MEEVKNNCFVTQEIVCLLPYGQRRSEQFLLQIITVVLLIAEMCTSKIRERTKVRLSSLVDDHLLSRLIDQWRATVDWLSSAFIFFECSPERNPRIDHHCLLLSRHYCNGEEKKVIYIIQGVVIVFFLLRTRWSMRRIFFSHLVMNTCRKKNVISTRFFLLLIARRYSVRWNLLMPILSNTECQQNQ